MSAYLKQLLAHYRAAGLYGERSATYAPTACTCAPRCWAGESPARFPKKPPARKGEAYRPWIGAHYNRSRLVLVGENFFEHGGFDEMENLIRWVIPKLKQGVKRMTFGNKKRDYGGSLFQHRAALYAQVWMEALGLGRIPIGDVYDHVALTNQVKCSPRASARSRSRPNKAMWTNCGRHVLAGELSILGAQRVLIVGKSWNAGAFRARVWPGMVSVARSGKVERLRAPDGREAVVVPHPASPGCAAWSIRDDVERVVRHPIP